jgi:hypothetical protein
VGRDILVSPALLLLYPAGLFSLMDKILSYSEINEKKIKSKKPEG